jgi:hypothetical protein
MKLLQDGIPGFWGQSGFLRAAINLKEYRAAVFARQLKDVMESIKSIYTSRRFNFSWDPEMINGASRVNRTTLLAVGGAFICRWARFPRTLHTE